MAAASSPPSGPVSDLDPEWVRQILEVQDALVLILDEEGVVTYFNRACEEVSGLASAEVIGHPLGETLIPEAERAPWRQAFAKMIDGETRELARENDWVDSSGQRRTVAWRNARVPAPGGGGVWIVATGIEVTDLRESEARYRWLSAATIEGITHHDRGTIVDVNQRCCEIFGYTVEEMMGRSVLDFATEASRPVILDRIKQGLTGDYEVVGLRKDGSTFPLEIATRMGTDQGRPLRIAGLRDISERKRLEAEHTVAQEQLARAQRMESVGVLAGGVAHDFNNLLSIILGFTQLAARDTRIPAEVQEHLHEILSATEIAAKLTHQLLVFAKREPVAAKSLCVNERLEEMLPLIRHSFKEDVDLKVELCDTPWPARIGHVHLEQVIINLALNAADAMPRGGRVRIATSTLRATEALDLTSGALPAGAYVKIRFQDEGVGMTPEVRERIFEPFFSTKRDRDRTGLGLSVVYGIIENLGGGIDVESAPDQGCTMEIYLPRGQAITRTPTDAESVSSGPPATILLVEDKEALLDLFTRILSTSGYQVLSASSGSEALSLLEGLERAPDLLITDVIMPGLSGPELSSAIQSSHPDLPVLFMSGYSDEVLLDHELSGCHFISKPFRAEKVLAMVASILVDTRS